MGSNTNITFPRQEYSKVILFALGTYQIRQAKFYYSEQAGFMED